MEKIYGKYFMNIIISSYNKIDLLTFVEIQSGLKNSCEIVK